MSKNRRMAYNQALYFVRRAALEEIEEMAQEFKAEDGDDFDPEPWNDSRTAIQRAETIAAIIDQLNVFDMFQDPADIQEWLLAVLVVAPKHAEGEAPIW